MIATVENLKKIMLMRFKFTLKHGMQLLHVKQEKIIVSQFQKQNHK